ncbi:tyrosine-protein phosphatase [Ornithinimicrobium murale]|uniref:tyrosine-protein phosphatase n=1 Tax=Ornithinimicrobium murale TaxID=1050153 RepID=UPI0013B3843C|nr:tyrosine-protein phosphatase [Ornithinimicrobium murale]
MPLISLRPPNWRAVPTALGRAQEPTIFRSAALTVATVQERATCPVDLTWIDLRTTVELDDDPEVTLPRGWVHRHFPLVDARLEEVEQSTEVMLRSLAEGTVVWSQRYIEMLDSAPDRFAAVLTELLSVDGPVAVGCAGGRDRTGVTAALLLALAEAPRRVIVSDYIATNTDLADNLGRQPTAPAEELRSQIDLTCRERDMDDVLDHLDSLGGVQSYLARALPAVDVAELAAAARARLS